MTERAQTTRKAGRPAKAKLHSPAKGDASKAPAKAPPPPAAPSVGRIVHMYDHALPEGGHGGHEHGPYAAIVTAVRPAGKETRHDHSVSEVDTPELVDLWVMPPAMTAYERGAVPYQEAPHPHVAGAAPEFARYWTWPPRS